MPQVNASMWHRQGCVEITQPWLGVLHIHSEIREKFFPLVAWENSELRPHQREGGREERSIAVISGSSSE